MSFLTYLRRDLEQILFPDRDPHAIPSMDGPFSPNDRLDEAVPIGEPIPGADAIAGAADGALFVSAGKSIWRLSGADYANRAMLAELGGDIGALACHPDGRVLAATAQGLAAIDPATGRTTSLLAEAGGERLRCLTAVAVTADGRIFASDGSTRHPADGWCDDLMERNKFGRIIGCDAGLGNARVALRGLEFPGGLAVADGQLWFTESFAHRLSRAEILSGGTLGAPRVAIRNMPGYPCRLSGAADGFWLSLFGVRTHLVEFVLREDDFRREMMRTIPRQYWVAPALATEGDCLEPMQFGGIKALGIQKPWAPPRSYGLIARLDRNGEPIESLHSRVGGRYHGITAALEVAQGLVVTSKGSGRVLLLGKDARA